MQRDFRSSYSVPGGHIISVEREGRTLHALAQDIHQQIERAYGPTD